SYPTRKGGAAESTCASSRLAPERRARAAAARAAAVALGEKSVPARIRRGGQCMGRGGATGVPRGVRGLSQPTGKSVRPTRAKMRRAAPIRAASRREGWSGAREHAVRRMPIVDDDQALIGVVVALDDVILALASGLAAVADTIRKEM